MKEAEIFRVTLLFLIVSMIVIISVIWIKLKIEEYRDKHKGENELPDMFKDDERVL
jgi:hypothetical protein